MRLKKVLILLVSICFFVTGCATMQYPETPKGKATFFTGSYHRLINEYNTELAWATQETHKEILSQRRDALIKAYVPIRIMSGAIATGKPVDMAMIDAANVGLMEVKRYLYTMQAIAPTKSTVFAGMLKAGMVEEYESQALAEGILVLIELIQAMLPLWQQLQEQAAMDEAQLEIRFGIEHGWITSFDPNSLPVVQ
jgi:hypothetical protein